MQIELKKVFNYINTTSWSCDISNEIIYEKALQVFNEITEENNYTKTPKFYRLSGQSGSGKTTQLLPAVYEFEKQQGKKPVVVAVRNFAEYHPDFTEMLKNSDKNQIRERTNGFALKCLCVVLNLLIEHGFLIILELTILHPVIEKFILSLLKENNYSVNYHIMAVGKEISSQLVNKRRTDTISPESGRIVNKTTVSYFIKIMPKGLKYLAKKDNESTAFIWTAFDKIPIYIGKISGALAAIKQGQAIVQDLITPEKVLRSAKLQFLVNYKSGSTTSE